MVGTYLPQKGDVVWLDFSPQAGREQKGRRPGLVVSSKNYNKIGLMLICPITGKIKGYPFEVEIKAGRIQGCVLADHVKNQDWRERNVEFVAKAPVDVLQKTHRIIAALLMD